VTGEKDFQRRLEIIERGIRELEATGDPGMRATVQQLVQSILELHARSLGRLLEIVGGSGIAGPAIIEQFGRDALVRNLLLLHSLHPLTIEARVRQALEDVRPSLRAQRADVELLSVADGAVRVRLLGGPEQKAAVERAIVGAAPDLSGLDIEGSDDTVVGFVSIDSLRRLPEASPQHRSPLLLTRGA
jgi:hypothetical protein